MGAKKVGFTEEGAVLFYENAHYMFSNFSSFAVKYNGIVYPTAEHAYQAAKFDVHEIREKIRCAPSAHDAKKIAHSFVEEMRDDWDDEMKLRVMEQIIWEKLSQHPYIQQKLADTGMREIIENSHHDPYWGWGADEKGENNLGKIWMKVRGRMRTKQEKPDFFGDTPFDAQK